MTCLESVGRRRYKFAGAFLGASDLSLEPGTMTLRHLCATLPRVVVGLLILVCLPGVVRAQPLLAPPDPLPAAPSSALPSVLDTGLMQSSRAGSADSIGPTPFAPPPIAGPPASGPQVAAPGAELLPIPLDAAAGAEVQAQIEAP